MPVIRWFCAAGKAPMFTIWTASAIWISSPESASNALGHAHPRILKVIRQQAGLLVHCSNLYYHEYQGALAKKLAEVSGLQRTFFCNSGTEAMEGALKMVRAHGNKTSAEKIEILSMENSFHGRTLGALSITGQPKYRKDFEPLLAGVKFLPQGDIAALEGAVNERTAGIVVEWIQGEGGIFPISAEYARKARELADRYNALLVFDENPVRRRAAGNLFLLPTDDTGGPAGRDGCGQAAGFADCR